MEPELALCRLAVEPMQLHPYHLDSPLNDGVIDETGCSGVVHLYGRFGLFPAHFFQRVAEWYHFSCCEIQ